MQLSCDFVMKSLALHVYGECFVQIPATAHVRKSGLII